MRIVVNLTPDERMALGELSRREQRDPREQLRYLLREAARERGLLPQPNTNTNGAPRPEKRESAVCG
jgi:hypothetical protein